MSKTLELDYKNYSEYFMIITDDFASIRNIDIIFKKALCYSIRSINKQGIS